MKRNSSLAIVAFVTIILIQWLNVISWWSFLIPVFVIGILVGWKKLKVESFLCGFIAGFFAWILPTIFYEYVYEGAIMQQIADMIQLPYFLLLLIIGIIGGVTSGLALYSGYLLGRGKKEMKFMDEERT
jgi:hypothetical protein